MRFHSTPPVTRSFCGKCGTPLTYQHESRPDAIDVTTATLDEADQFAPSKEIFLEEKLVWERQNDAIPGFPRSSVKA